MTELERSLEAVPALSAVPEVKSLAKYAATLQRILAVGLIVFVSQTVIIFVLMWQSQTSPREIYRELVTFREEQKADRKEQQEFREWRRAQQQAMDTQADEIEQRLKSLINQIPKE